MSGGLLTLFARREPDRNYAYYGYGQVSLYKAGDSLPVAVYPFNAAAKPTSNSTTVRHNGFTYRLEWLPDLIGPPVHVGELRLRAMGFGPGRHYA